MSQALLALISLGLALALGPAARALGTRLGLTSPNGTPATGWLTLVLPWWILTLLGATPGARAFLGLALAMVPIVVIGTLDLRRARGPLPQLAAQLLAAVFAVALGGISLGYVTHPAGGLLYLNQWTFSGLPLPGAVISVVWIVVLMNAVNFQDGMDGLAPSASGIGFLAIAAVSFLPQVHEPAVALPALVAAGATAGMLFWNFPPARLHLGTPGAWFQGFLLAVLSIQGSSKIATLAVVGAIPLLDALAVVVGRLQRGASPFRGDTTHLHHRLAARGWSPRRVLLLYAGLSALLGVEAVVLPTPFKIALVAAAGVAVIAAALPPTALDRTNLPR